MIKKKFLSLKWEILHSFIAISFIPILILYLFLGWSAWILYKKHVEEETKKNLLLLKTNIEDLIINEKNFRRIIYLIKKTEDIARLKIWIIDKNNKPIFGSYNLNIDLDKIIKSYKQKIRNGACDKLICKISKKPNLLITELKVDNNKKYFILCEASTKKSGAAYIFKHLFAFWIIFLLIILVIVCIYSLYFSYRITNPIIKLKESAELISKGNLETKVEIDSKDELKILGDTFNKMVKNLRASYYQLSSILEYFRTFLDTIECVIIFLDKEAHIISVNKTLIRILGYTEKEIINKHIKSIWDDFKDEILNNTEKMTIFETTYLKNKKGEKIPFFMALSKIILENNQFFILTGQNLEDIYALYRKIQEERERLLVTLKSIGDAVIVTDDKGKVILINNMAEKLTGWKEEEAIGRKIDDIFKIMNDKTKKLYENPVNKVLKTGKIVSLESDTILLKKDGEEVYIGDSAAPIKDIQGKIIGVVLVFRDITKEKLLQNEIIKTEKLKSISLLAGGIAHDFNNILAAILGNLELANFSLDPNNKTKKYVINAQKAINLATNLTKQLLTFAKGGEPIKELASLKDIVKDSASFVLVGSNIRCYFDIEEDLWPVEVDKGQISQVIQNIVINARQAMPNGGNIIISCRNIPEEIAQKLNLYPVRPYVEISISDDGPGIPEEILEKIFEPFFTTKENGSGLGLAICYSIIHKHNGHIRVKSEVGKGTTFFIYLPAKKEKICEEDVCQIETIQEEKKYKGKILIMDDEEIIRDTTKEILTLLGYRVETAADGDEAIKLYRKALEENDPFDAVIMDLTIPGKMDGKETIKELLKIDPKIKAIVSSGYANDPVMAHYEQYGFKARLVKPYTLDKLKEVLRQVIEKA